MYIEIFVTNYFFIYKATFDYKTNTNPLVVHEFSYDTAGQPIPLVLTFENYDFRFINGEAYRNNPSTEEISVKIYVDDELVIEEAERGFVFVL